MKNFKRIAAVLMAVVILLGMAAVSAAADAGSKYGGRLKIVNYGSMATTSGFPLDSGTIENLANFPAIERLAIYDANRDLVPCLAKEIQVDKENLTITIILNEGISFTNGNPFNAQTVADVWDITREVSPAKLSGVGSWEVKGEYEIVVTLASWVTNIAGNLLVEAGAMFDPQMYREVGAEGMYTNIVGTGPFVMTEYKVGEQVSFDRNPNYWGKDAEGNQLPYLDGIDIIQPADSVSACNILRSGDADCMINMGAMDYATLTQMEGFVPFGEGAPLSQGLNGVFFASGNENDPVSNLKVRQAFCYAIDTQAIVDATTYGTAQSTNQLAVPGTVEYNPDVVGYPYNPEKAAELLAEAGYAPGECEVTLSYFVAFQDMYTIMQNYLEAAGFKVKLDLFENAVYGNKILVNGDNLDPYTSTCIWVAPTTADAWFRYFSANPSTMVKNAMDLQSAGVVDVYDTVQHSTDDATQKQALKELQVKCIDELCLFMPVLTTPSLVCGNDYVMDSGINEITTIQWTPATAWLNK